MGTSTGERTHMVRASQGRSSSSGVAADVLPIDEEVLYFEHGTSFEAAYAIVMYGIYRSERLLIHFHAIDVSGQHYGTNQMRHGTQVVIIVAAPNARDGWVVFYRSPNSVVIAAGEQGIIPPRFIRRVIDYQSRQTLWGNRTVEWEINEPVSTPPIANGKPFAEASGQSLSGDNMARSSGQPEHRDRSRGPFTAGTGSLFDNQPYDGLGMATAGDSGIFDSGPDDEGVRAKQEWHVE